MVGLGLGLCLKQLEAGLGLGLGLEQLVEGLELGLNQADDGQGLELKLIFEVRFEVVRCHFSSSLSLLSHLKKGDP